MRWGDGTDLALGQGIEDGPLYVIRVFIEAHMLQHHYTTQQQGSRVRETLACDIRRGTVHGFEDGALVADVAGGRQAQATDQPGAHIRQDITVQIGHHQDLVIVGRGIRDDLQAGVVEQLGVKVHFCEILADVAGRVQEQSVRHLHDCCFVYRTDLGPAYILGVLEGEPEDALRGLSGDEFDALNDAVDDHVLDS